MRRSYSNEYQEVNNASGNVMGAGGTPVKAVGLDRIIRHVTDRGRFRVRLMKLDCEGSEYPILFTAKTLHLVDAIVGEFHNITEEHGPTHPFYRIPENARVAGYDEFNGDVLVETRCAPRASPSAPNATRSSREARRTSVLRRAAVARPWRSRLLRLARLKSKKAACSRAAR